MNIWVIVGAVTPILTAVGAVTFWFVRVTVRAEIAAANDEQLRKINGTYVRAAGSTMTGAEIERALRSIAG